jgi:exopolysaccharide production protein ExoQ
MPPPLALTIWFVLLVLLLRYDPARDPQASRALLVPLVWLTILSSKLPSLWLGTAGGFAAEALEEGNWLDRAVYLTVIVLGVVILAVRSLQWNQLWARNRALVLCLAFALVSLAWSDFPFVSLKRWFRDFGTYLMVLLILTEPRPLEAMATIVRRVCYLVVPLSIVLIKYYTHIGVGYDVWSGAPNYKGVTYNKNSLGALCIVSGVFFFWDSSRRWRERNEVRTKQILLVNGAFMVMTLWLLKLSQSATSQLCLLIACLVIATAHSRFARTNPVALKVAIPGATCLYLVLEFAVGITELLTVAMGRNPSLTGRTDVWAATMALNPSPLLGAGYESFWLGDRVEALWTMFYWRPTQAHSGYVEVYLNLGLLGLGLLSAVLLASYLRMWRLPGAVEFRSLGLAWWAVLVLYNVTEAAFFKSHRLWFMFLLVSVVVPRASHDRIEPQRMRRVTSREIVSE